MTVFNYFCLCDLPAASQKWGGAGLIIFLGYEKIQIKN